MTDQSTPDPRLVAALERALATQAVVTVLSPDAPPIARSASLFGREQECMPRDPLHLVAEGPGWLVVSLGDPAAEGVCETCDGEGGRDIAVADGRAPGVYSFPCPDCEPAPSQPERSAIPQRPELPPGYSADKDHARPGFPCRSASAHGPVADGPCMESVISAAWRHFNNSHPEWAAYLDAVAQPVAEPEIAARLRAVLFEHGCADTCSGELYPDACDCDCWRWAVRGALDSLESQPAIEAPPLPEGCTWDGVRLVSNGRGDVDVDVHMGHLRCMLNGRHVCPPLSYVRYVLWQHDRAARAAGGGQ